MDVIYIVVLQSDFVYDNIVIRKNCAKKNTVNAGENSWKPTKRKVKLFIDGNLLYYFVQELCISPAYRSSFMRKFYAETNKNSNVVEFHLIPVTKEAINYSWNYQITHLVRERCELEHTLSWLSTLGGAFSALGDYFLDYAEIAGKISLNQLQLAFRLGDPNIISRCRLYLSLSLIQRSQFKLAKHIIRSEYVKAKSDVVVDNRLVSMCKGIWCKLKYDYYNHRKHNLKGKK